jgi:choline dehydrogenase
VPARTAGYDFIIVGGGSSGCVAASRLVQEHDARVLLVEAGRAKGHPLLAMPAGYMKFLAHDTYLTMHRTEPQPQLDGRAPIVPQARLLGGGSAVNAMVYMRGRKADYDGWGAIIGGNAGWSYADLLTYFKAQEDNDTLAGEYHGVGGPLSVSHLGFHSEASRAFVKAVQALGYPFNPDFNGAAQRGVGYMQHTIDHRRQRRCSAVDAFLRPVLADPRLTVVTGARVTRILVEAGRAIGIEYVKGVDVERAQTHGEVLLAAGTYETPKILMLSGIGPAAHLTAHGIAVRADLPGVGENLQDHHEVPIVAATTGAYGHFGEDRGWRMVRNGLAYVLLKSGRVTTTGVEACAFVDPDERGEETIQLYCVPTVYLDRDVTGLEPTHGVTLNACLLRPKARGRVRLRSSDPSDPPAVDCRFFGDEEDLRLSVEGVRFARRVLEAEPLAGMVDREIFPGPSVADDAGLAAHCRRTVKTNYHPVGTCRMGHDGDPMAVLDTQLRVRGVEGVRVIDCSLMPTIVSGNTNAPAMAIAAKAVDLIAPVEANGASKGEAPVAGPALRR